MHEYIFILFPRHVIAIRNFDTMDICKISVWEVTLGVPGKEQTHTASCMTPASAKGYGSQ